MIGGRERLLFRSADTEALVDRLVRLSVRADRERMGRKARETVVGALFRACHGDRYDDCFWIFAGLLFLPNKPWFIDVPERVDASGLISF